VGTMHAPYLEREIGAEGVMAVRALVTALDPRGTLNPGVLLSGDGA
jgi:alkyldihydroxyacetonephosphate synthase